MEVWIKKFYFMLKLYNVCGRSCKKYCQDSAFFLRSHFAFEVVVDRLQLQVQKTAHRVNEQRMTKKSVAVFALRR
jgi:hypothetical protein